MKFDFKACNFSGKPAPANGGRFYTDRYGRELRDGPGENNMMQFMTKDFVYPIDGKYNIVDTWQGLYIKDAFGHFRNVNGGLKPRWN